MAPVAATHGLHQDPLEARVEGHHLHLAVARKEPLDDGPAKSLAHPRGELQGVLNARRVLGQHLDDAPHVADIDALVEQVLQHPLHGGQGSSLGTRSSTSLGLSLAMCSSRAWVSVRPRSSEAWLRMRWLMWVATTVLASTTV
jgi:hypothetical protein